MAGRGPAPKPADQRARRNKPAIPLRVIEVARADQPGLPEFEHTVWVDNVPHIETFSWPEITRQWWQMWADSPLSADYTATDWAFLLDTALIHAKFWGGDKTLAGELRQRVAKFGATPEDRARLQIQFATAEAAEESRERRATHSSTSRDRLKTIKGA